MSLKTVLKSFIHPPNKDEFRQELRDIMVKYHLETIGYNEGTIVADKPIVVQDRELILVDYAGGYRPSTAYKLIEKHKDKLAGKAVYIIREIGGVNIGTMFDDWAIYVSTGRTLRDGKP